MAYGKALLLGDLAEERTTILALHFPRHRQFFGGVEERGTEQSRINPEANRGIPLLLLSVPFRTRDSRTRSTSTTFAVSAI